MKYSLLLLSCLFVSGCYIPQVNDDVLIQDDNVKTVLKGKVIATTNNGIWSTDQYIIKIEQIDENGKVFYFEYITNSTHLHKLVK